MATYSNEWDIFVENIARALAGIFSGIQFLLVALLTPARRCVKGEGGFWDEGWRGKAL